MKILRALTIAALCAMSSGCVGFLAANFGGMVASGVVGALSGDPGQAEPAVEDREFRVHPSAGSD